MPPLRDRGADIELLARHFVLLLSERFGVRKRIAASTLDVLRRHDWPGNVRELLHVIEAAVVVCDGPDILPEHLPAHLRGPGAAPPAAGGNGPLPTLEELERGHIELALRTTHGHRGHAARALGISERNLYRKLRAYGLLP
jgi:DNA-binding NtrC family response regulator